MSIGDSIDVDNDNDVHYSLCRNVLEQRHQRRSCAILPIHLLVRFSHFPLLSLGFASKHRWKSHFLPDYLPCLAEMKFIAALDLFESSSVFIVCREFSYRVFRPSWELRYTRPLFCHYKFTFCTIEPILSRCTLISLKRFLLRNFYPTGQGDRQFPIFQHHRPTNCLIVIWNTK